ncbi:MAG: zf-HC2 domain-containing protein [Gaiellaceae bacterium]
MGALKSGCERAREWVSLDLDGELSELEDAQLRAHLGRCLGCAGFASDLRGTTAALRAAPLEPLAAVVTFPAGRSRTPRVLQVGAAAAAVALAVGLGSLAGLRGSPTPPAPTAAAAFAATQAPYIEQRLLAMDRAHPHPAGGRTIAV